MTLQPSVISAWPRPAGDRRDTQIFRALACWCISLVKFSSLPSLSSVQNVFAAGRIVGTCADLILEVE
jgi:hypothetical protein